MYARIVFLFLTVTIAFGCSIESNVTSDRPVTDAVSQAVDESVLHFGTEPDAEQLNMGQWEEKDGSRICHGYLTRIESEDFCAAEVPDDWTPFTYDGKTYYVQPLAGS
ncbi:MAG TPA: hypothetical protein PKH39_10700 [Woeseiaceae bacterium]|nr:hypothetical protein [Woeseiaceae bacterium]